MNGKHIKCMVWDLDQTIWNGILLEDDRISLKKPVIDIIKTCDERGILHSIASKNEYDLAVRKLKSFGLLDYFIYPQINWSAKSNSINTIADKLGFDLDTFMFIDDQPFEREQVRSVFPQVRCVDPDELNIWLDQPQLNPPQTHESQNRRIMYQAEEKRAKEEEKFVGPRESFLASLDMHLRISPVIRTDLERAEELCNRTNQLNTTGYSYSMDELNRFRQSQNHRLLIASLDDKFGSYGKIGLCLIECQEKLWIIKLFLMSCRVITRGVGMIFLRYIINLAKQQDVRLQAEFKQTSRNRMMLVTYKFAGFEIISERANALLFENNYKHLQPYPGYVKLNTDHS